MLGYIASHTSTQLALTRLQGMIETLSLCLPLKWHASIPGGTKWAGIPVVDRCLWTGCSCSLGGMTTLACMAAGVLAAEIIHFSLALMANRGAPIGEDHTHKATQNSKFSVQCSILIQFQFNSVQCCKQCYSFLQIYFPLQFQWCSVYIVCCVQQLKLICSMH